MQPSLGRADECSTWGMGGQASAAITSGQPKEVGSRTQDRFTMLASTGPLLDSVGVCRALMHWGLGVWIWRGTRVGRAVAAQQ